MVYRFVVCTLPDFSYTILETPKIICVDISRKLQIVGLFVIGPFFLAHLFIKTTIKLRFTYVENINWILIASVKRIHLCWSSSTEFVL